MLCTILSCIESTILGIIKIRQEMLPKNHEKEWEKDELGAKIKKYLKTKDDF